MRPLWLGLFVAASLSAAQGQQTFTGVITDDMCPLGTHENMRMGPTDAECAKACVVAHGAAWVLADGATAYGLSDQKAPEAFAAKKVRVTGTLDPKTRLIQVTAIAAVD